jgi:hypothetical protein
MVKGLSHAQTQCRLQRLLFLPFKNKAKKKTKNKNKKQKQTVTQQLRDH